MAATSTMTSLGLKAPPFLLNDTVGGKPLSLGQLQGSEATVIMFLCNHCPYVKHVNTGLVRVAQDYGKKGVSFVAISSNDIEAYPEDSPDRMREVATTLGYPFPYLFDATQEVARKYGAACTPDIFVFDKKLKLAYRGQLDDSRPGNSVPVTGKDLRAALDALVTGQAVFPDQRPSVGCSIKWKRA